MAVKRGHLELVEATPNPWDQRSEESDEAYLLFLRWLHSPTPRELPDETVLAQRYRWAERAKAYDSAIRLERTDKDRFKATLRNLLRLVLLESKKLVNVSLETEGQTLAPRELIAMVDLLQSTRDKAALRALLDEDEADTVDLGQFTDEELAVIRQIKKRIAK